MAKNTKETMTIELITSKEITKPTQDELENTIKEETPPAFEFSSRRLSCKWSTGAGPRIGCVRDYPADLQFKALEQVNLSPRVMFSPKTNKIPIPSPRPSSKVHLSPRLAYMGIPTPPVSLTLPQNKRRLKSGISCANSQGNEPR